MRRQVAVGAGVLGALAALALIASALGDGAAEDQVDGPVVSLGEDWNGYPAAQVTGRIVLEGGCLLLDGSVVFWPHGTTWDEDQQAVAFGGDFEDSTPAVVGEKFTGGGGYFPAANVEGLDGLDSDAVLQCLRETNAKGIVFAYPDG